MERKTRCRTQITGTEIPTGRGTSARPVFVCKQGEVHLSSGSDSITEKIGVVSFFVRNLNCGGASWAILLLSSAAVKAKEDAARSIRRLQTTVFILDKSQYKYNFLSENIQFHKIWYINKK